VSDRLSIGEVAARAGVEPSTLRFYEAEGLITAERTEGGQRRYHRDVLRRIAFIRIAQRVGLSLDEVRRALATLPEQRTPTGAGCRATGAAGSTSRSACSASCATSSPTASAAAACRFAPATSTTRTTAPPVWAAGLVTCWATRPPTSSADGPAPAGRAAIRAR